MHNVVLILRGFFAQKFRRGYDDLVMTISATTLKPAGYQLFSSKHFSKTFKSYTKSRTDGNG